MGRGASAPLPFFAVGSERTWRASSPPCPCREHARGGGCSRRQALFHFVYPEAPNPAEKVPQPLCLEFEKTGLLDGLNGCLAFLLFQRSEEHTSELQSLMRIPYAVFCLKKKITKTLT